MSNSTGAFPCCTYGRTASGHGAEASRANSLRSGVHQFIARGRQRLKSRAPADARDCSCSGLNVNGGGNFGAAPDWDGKPSVWQSVLALNHEISLDGRVLAAEERTRQDEQDDSIFYCMPRFVQYVDQGFTQKLTEWYSLHLTRGGAVLDLCSAYDSHLPEGVELSRVTGHGMCRAELGANAALDDYFIQDLNRDPRIPLHESEFDGVLCCMGLQYLTHPEAVLSEVQRVLRPGGKVLLSFTTHAFPEKTLAAWLDRTLDDRVDLAKRLLREAGFEDIGSTVWIPEPDTPSVVSDSILDATVDGEEVLSSRFSVDHPLEPEPLADPPDPFCGVVATCPAVKTSRNWYSNASSLTEGPDEPATTSMCDAVLDEIELWAGKRVGGDTLRRWASAYSTMARQAEALGIPKSVIPQLDPDRLTLESLIAHRNRLRGMMASFISAGL